MTSSALDLSGTTGLSARTRVAILAAGFCSMLNLYAPQAILPTLADIFHATPVEIGLTITATTLAVAVFGPFSGVIADTFGRKRVIVAALVCLSVPTFLSAMSTTLPQLLATRFLQGMVMPAAFAASLGYVAEEFGRGQTGRIMALYVAANVSGGFAGRFLGGLAAQFGDWHWTFFVLAAVNLLGAILVWRFLPEPTRPSRRDGLRVSLRAMLGHVRNPRLLATYFVGFNVLFGLVTVFTYVNFYLSAPPFRLAPAQLGLVFCVYLIGIVVTPFAGRWIDRLGQRKAVAASTLVATAGCLLTLIPSLAAVIAGLALFCSAAFVNQASATSQVGLIAGANRSAAAGLYLSFYYGGGALGAVLPGYAWASGGWRACILLAIGVQMLVATTALLLFRSRDASR